MDVNQLLSQKIASVCEAPLNLNDLGTQLSITRGFLEGLQKDGGLNVREAIGFLEYVIEQAPLEKTAGLGDALSGLRAKLEGAAAGWMHSDTVQDLKNGNIGNILGKGWDYAQQNIFTPENMKTIAPYVVSGLGSFLGAKALGADNLQAGAAGVAGGALGGTAYRHFPDIKQRIQEWGQPLVEKAQPVLSQASAGFQEAAKQTGDYAEKILSNVTNR